jgi:hypothetical protein
MYYTVQLRLLADLRQLDVRDAVEVIQKPLAIA